MRRTTLSLWQSFSSKPGGKWAFSRLLCLKAPYFGSIRPQFEELRPQYCEVRMRKRRAVLNHIGTVHAVAMCNMAELAGGTMTEVTIPSTHRWIPKGMTVRYLKMAKTDLVAIATPQSQIDWSVPGEFKVNVVVRDQQAEPVFDALITMWVAPRKLRSGAA
ncbi:hotdog fold domain-containing protein [Lysobacter sp. A286]